MTVENELSPTKVKEELLKVFPAKVARKRSKAIVVNEPGASRQIQANTRTVPGIISMRG
ncbi:MAG TPA: nitrogenase molybdenum-iron protein alpha chain, partial [Phycisphaerales bacterium]|nr:nitrogenase molybdenum-iron protein alpha chain [Phycisphaerales bacterium]